MDAVLQLSSTVGVESACDVLGVARASFYRHRPLLGPALAIPFLVPVARPTPARARVSTNASSSAPYSIPNASRTARPLRPGYAAR